MATFTAEQLKERYRGRLEPVAGAASMSSSPDRGSVTGNLKEAGFLSDFADGIGEKFNERTNRAADAQIKAAQGEQADVSAVAQTLGEGAGFVGDIANEGLEAADKALTGGKVGDFLKNVVESDEVQGAVSSVKDVLSGLDDAITNGKGKEFIDSLSDEDKANMEAAFNVLSLVPAGKGAKIAGEAGTAAAQRVATEGAKQAQNAAAATANAAKAAADVVGGAKDIAGGMAGSAARGARNFADEVVDTANTKKALKDKGKSAVRVYEETGTPEFVTAVDKTKSKADLAAKAKMLDLVESNKKLGGDSDALPRSVVADDYVVPKVDTLRKRLEEVGKVIGDAEKGTNKFQRVDARDVYEGMVGDAKRLGIEVSQPVPGGPLEFKKASGVTGIDESRVGAIKQLFTGMVPSKTGSVYRSPAQLAQSRKNLSALTKRSDAAAEVVAPGGPIDNTRRAIAKKLGDDYYNATREFSDIARVLEQLDPDLKVRLSDDSIDEISRIKFADLSRRLLSNNAAQARATFKSLDELHAKEMARQGKKVEEQDLADLVDFAGALEEGFGIQPRNSFFGQTKGAVNNAIEGIPLSVGGAVNAVANILTRPKVNNKRVLEAMRAYLKEAQEK